MENKKIVFAIYKDDNLVGFRQDTFGTLGTDWAKTYTYSPEQVECIIENVTIEANKGFGVSRILKACGYEKKDFKAITEMEADKYTQLQQMGSFELRVIEAPEEGYDFKLWAFRDHEPIEIHEIKVSHG